MHASATHVGVMHASGRCGSPCRAHWTIKLPLFPETSLRNLFSGMTFGIVCSVALWVNKILHGDSMSGAAQSQNRLLWAFLTTCQVEQNSYKEGSDINMWNNVCVPQFMYVLFHQYRWNIYHKLSRPCLYQWLSIYFNHIHTRIVRSLDKCSSHRPHSGVCSMTFCRELIHLLHPV